MSSRHLSRSITLQTLFMWDFNGEDSQNLNFYIDYNIQECVPADSDVTFIKKLSHNIVFHKEKIDQTINTYTKEWPVDRLTIADRNILRIAIFEMFYAKDIPTKVALNEAVELAKEYNGPSSQKFVSGVLGAIYDKHFKNNEKHITTGKKA